MNRITARYYKYLFIVLSFLITGFFYTGAGFFIRYTLGEVYDEKNNLIGVERMLNLTNEMVRDYDIIFKNTKKLSDFITNHPDATQVQQENFISKVLMPRDLTAFFNRKNTDFVYAYVIAPDDIVSVVYSNNKINPSDLAYFTDDTSAYYLNLAKGNPEDVVVQGPMLSGKTHDVLVFNRQAIFVNGKYWGYVGLCADFYRFLECVRLNVEDDMFVYAIRSSIHKGNRDFIWGDSSLFKHRYANSRQKSLFFGKQRWDLALRVKDGARATSSYHKIYAVLFVLFLLTETVIIILIHKSFTMTAYKAVDQLTMSLNHDTFIQLVQRELSGKSEHALIMVELLNFKQVNNIFGYETGDEVLNEVNSRIRSVIGYNDKMCRVGAEFIVLMRNIRTTIDVDRTVGELQSALEHTVFANNFALKQKVLIGSSNTIEQGRDIKNLLHALNNSIDSEKNVYHNYSSNMTKSLQKAEVIMNTKG